MFSRNSGREILSFFTPRPHGTPQFKNAIADNRFFLCASFLRMNVDQASSSASSGPNASILTRKRQRRPDTWKKNVRKKAVQSGTEHCSKSKTIPQRSVKPSVCKCIHQCRSKINDNDRNQIFVSFWQAGTQCVASAARSPPHCVS